MKCRPILFASPMARAILAGHKTQTRRVVRGPGPYGQHHWPGEIPGRPGWWTWWTRPEGAKARASSAELAVRCPYGVPGGRLWVRETWRPGEGDAAPVHYRADAEPPAPGPWRSGRFMRREHSRMTLAIQAIGIQRLHEITDLDVMCEGACPAYARSETPEGRPRLVSEFTGVLHDDPRALFSEGWDALNGRREGCCWKDNPWVWRIEFRREAP